MKTKTIILLMAVLFLSMGSVGFAATTINVNVSATVPTMLELTSWIKYFMDDSFTPVGDATDFSFGTLTHTLANGNEAGVWFSRKWFTIYLNAATGGRRYQIKQTCAGVTSGANNINSAFIVAPGYSQADQSIPNPPAIPYGTLGTIGLAVATDRVIYTSDPNGQSLVIQGVYAIPNNPSPVPAGFTAISLNQPGGAYSGTVTFTVVLY